MSIYIRKVSKKENFLNRLFKPFNDDYEQYSGGEAKPE